MFFSEANQAEDPSCAGALRYLLVLTQIPKLAAIQIAAIQTKQPDCVRSNLIKATNQFHPAKSQSLRQFGQL